MPRLTHTYTTTESSSMEDFITVLLANVEDGLLQAGAKPGVDYTMHDLIVGTMPLLQSRWAEPGCKLTYTVSWP